MNKKQNIEENPKEVIANQVVTPTRKYFVPGFGEVEAVDLADVQKQLKKLKKQEVKNVHD